MSILIEPHLDHIRARRFSATTIHDRGRLLAAADDELPKGLDRAGTEELEQFLANPRWKGWTPHTYYSHLVGFYRWAVGGRDPHLTWDPTVDMTPPKSPDQAPHPVSDLELERALDSSSPRWRLIITLAAYAGLRAIEICRIRREDVTQEQIRVLGKGGKTAMLRTHPEIWRLVEPLPPGLLVPSTTTGRQLARGALSSGARQHFDRLGMPDVHLHRFRHWYATMLIREGVDVSVVRVMMRHVSLATTAGYIQIGDEQLRLAISKLPVLGTATQQSNQSHTQTVTPTPTRRGRRPDRSVRRARITHP